MNETKVRQKGFLALLLVAIIVLGMPGMSVLAATYTTGEAASAQVLHAGDTITFAVFSNDVVHSIRTSLSICEVSNSSNTYTPIVTSQPISVTNTTGSVTIPNGDWVYVDMVYAFYSSGGFLYTVTGNPAGLGDPDGSCVIQFLVTPNSSGSFSSSSGDSSAEAYYRSLKALVAAINIEGGDTHGYGIGTALPYSIMKALEDNPEDTLVFKCEYKGNRYTFTIHGADVKGKISAEIPWYGPYWLAQNFYTTTVIEPLEPVTPAQ